MGKPRFGRRSMTVNVRGRFVLVKEWPKSCGRVIRMSLPKKPKSFYLIAFIIKVSLLFCLD